MTELEYWQTVSLIMASNLSIRDRFKLRVTASHMLMHTTYKRYTKLSQLTMGEQ